MMSHKDINSLKMLTSQNGFALEINKPIEAPYLSNSSYEQAYSHVANDACPELCELFGSRIMFDAGESGVLEITGLYDLVPRW